MTFVPPKRDPQGELLFELVQKAIQTVGSRPRLPDLSPGPRRSTRDLVLQEVARHLRSPTPGIVHFVDPVGPLLKRAGDIYDVLHSKPRARPGLGLGS